MKSAVPGLRGVGKGRSEKNEGLSVGEQAALLSTISHSCRALDSPPIYLQNLSVSALASGGKKGRSFLPIYPIIAKRGSLLLPGTSGPFSPTTAPALEISSLFPGRTRQRLFGSASNPSCSSRSAPLPDWLWLRAPATYASLLSWQKRKGNVYHNTLCTVLKHTLRHYIFFLGTIYLNEHRKNKSVGARENEINKIKRVLHKPTRTERWEGKAWCNRISHWSTIHAFAL